MKGKPIAAAALLVLLTACGHATETSERISLANDGSPSTVCEQSEGTGCVTIRFDASSGPGKSEVTVYPLNSTGEADTEAAVTNTLKVGETVSVPLDDSGFRVTAASADGKGGTGTFEVTWG